MFSSYFRSYYTTRPRVVRRPMIMRRKRARAAHPRIRSRLSIGTTNKVIKVYCEGQKTCLRLNVSWWTVQEIKRVEDDVEIQGINK